MLVRLHAAALRGVDAVPVTVEVRVDRGIHFLMVGLPDSAVRESQQRIKSAIEHLGFRWPGKGITINLPPLDCAKKAPPMTCHSPWEFWRHRVKLRPGLLKRP